MSGATMAEGRRRHRVASSRPHDYLYDSAYIVSGARDYARSAFKAAMGSAQLIIQPVYTTMFSELRHFPRNRAVYYPNCRLPNHMDTSYMAYVCRVQSTHNMPAPQLGGKDRFKFAALPKKVLDTKATSPDFHPPSPPTISPQSRPRNKGTQSLYRESSAQTIPWQAGSKAADTCEQTPEVMYLDKLLWGPGAPYRTADLPADFHTTEIINKMRHARVWNEVAERGRFPRWMKRREAIISDVETKDWIFREAEIDELQEIRLSLLHKLQSEKRNSQTSKTSRRLSTRWASNKQEMERKIDHIRKSRDRELRKLAALHSGGGRLGLVQRMRAARAMGSPTLAAADPTSDVFAPMACHGYQARGKHAEITYDPSLLLLEDHLALAEPPAWLEQCGQNLRKTCSGQPLPRDPMTLCERETKWSEDFLEKLHNDLKKARVGAAGMTAGPLHVLKPRRLQDTPRPATPEVDAVMDTEEAYHQAALHMQRIIRGRAVQCLMYEGRTRAAELTEELKTTHGLQREDKIRIASEEAKARDYTALRTEAEKKEDAITALVDELCGGAVSAALDFLEKELRRLKEERKQHAFILIAMREKQMREAAEAGRRQKEIHRRREHDEMFKQVLGITQDTVESYLQKIIADAVELNAEEEGERRARKQADEIDAKFGHTENLPTAEQNELIAELVQQFLLPTAHKAAAQLRVQSQQAAKLEAARRAIFGLLDDAEIREPMCTVCGAGAERCRCRECPLVQRPRQSDARDDQRWKAVRTRPRPAPKSPGERFPPAHEFRCMLNTLIDEVVVESRRAAAEKAAITRECAEMLREGVEVELEAKDIIQEALDIATGVKKLPVFQRDYHYFSRRITGDALERTEPFAKHACPTELPSEIRRREDEAAAAAGGRCQCQESPKSAKSVKSVKSIRMAELEPRHMLPSELRELEELRRCKCDASAPPGDLDDMVTATSSGQDTWMDIESEPTVDDQLAEEQKREDEQ